MTKIYDVMGSLLYEDSKPSNDSTVGGAIDKGVDMRFAQLSQMNLIGLDLSYGKLTGACFVSSNLANVNCQDANLVGADFTDASLKNADLRWADLRGANLQGCDLSGADLFRADLRGANITNAKLAGATLGGANLDNTRIYASLGLINIKDRGVYEEAKIELWASMGFRIEKISQQKLWASGQLWESLLVLRKKDDKEVKNG